MRRLPMIQMLALLLILPALQAQGHQIDAGPVTKYLDSQGSGEMSDFLAQLNEWLADLDTYMYDNETDPFMLADQWQATCSEQWEAIKEASDAAQNSAARVKRSYANRAPEDFNKWWNELRRIHKKLEHDARLAIEVKQRVQMQVNDFLKWIESNESCRLTYHENMTELARAVDEATYLTGQGSKQEIEDFLPEWQEAYNIAVNTAKASRNGITKVEKKHERLKLKSNQNDIPDRLTKWEVDLFHFMPYKLKVGKWHAHLENLLDEYIKQYDQWWNDLIWLREDKLLDRQSNLASWSFKTLDRKVKEIDTALRKRL